MAAWAATQALFWDEAKARARLEAFVEANQAHAFESRITLPKFDAGRLKTDWQP